MNWGRIKGDWRRLWGFARQQWSRLTGHYAGVIAGKREQRRGRIQALLGNAREADLKQLAEWHARQHKTDRIHK